MEKNAMITLTATGMVVRQRLLAYVEDPTSHYQLAKCGAMAACATGSELKVRAIVLENPLGATAFMTSMGFKAGYDEYTKSRILRALIFTFLVDG